VQRPAAAWPLPPLAALLPPLATALAPLSPSPLLATLIRHWVLAVDGL